MNNLSNEASNFFGVFNNYTADVAVTVLFGLGYYIVKTIRKRFPEGKSKEIKQNLDSALTRWNNAKDIEDFHEMIKKNYTTVDPYVILNSMASKGFVANIDTYNALLLNCFQNKNFEHSKILESEILNIVGPVTPNNFTLQILIKGLSLKYKEDILLLKKKNEPLNSIFSSFDNELLVLINNLEVKGVIMDVFAHNTIIDSLIDQGRLKEAWENYLYIRSNLDKLKVDYYTFTSIMKGIRLTPNIESFWLERAFEVYGDAKNESLDLKFPNDNFLNSLIDTCIKFKEIAKAELLFEKEVLNKEFDIESEYSYSIMIKGYGKTFNIEKAINLYEKLIINLAKLGNNPGIISIGCMINACIQCGQITKAEGYFNTSNEKNSYLLSSMIKGYRKGKEFYKALSLFEGISEDNLDIVIINAMLDCCVENNQFKKMEEIYEKTRNSELKIIPDIITYSIVIKGFAKTNKIEKIKNIYEFLRKNQYSIDEIMINTIMDCFARNCDETSLFEFYNELKSLNSNISVISYGILIKLYANIGNLTKANDIFCEMESKNISPNVVIYQTLIQLYCKKNLIFEAISFANRMKLKGIKGDFIFYNFMIKTCMYNFYYNDALNYIIEAINGNIKPEQYLIDNLVCYIAEDIYIDFKTKKKILTKMYYELTTLGYPIHYYIVEYISQNIYNYGCPTKKLNRKYHEVDSNKSIYIN